MSVPIAQKHFHIVCDSARVSGGINIKSDYFIILIIFKTNGLMTKTTIPFTFSHLKTPKTRYYMTRFVTIVKRYVIGLSSGLFE